MGKANQNSLLAILVANIERRMKETTQQVFARRAGIGQATVSRLVNLGQDVTLGRLQKIADGFKCAPYELLIADDEMRRQIVERYLRPTSPGTAATETTPAAGRGKGGVGRVVTEASLPPTGPTGPGGTFVEEPQERKEPRRNRRKRS